MTIEEQLKEYILERYKSIREFSLTVDMSNSTLDSILRRGIGNSSVSNIIKICKVLRISVDELANGRIVPTTVKVDSGLVEVSDILAEVKSQLTYTDGLTIDGKPAVKDSIDSLLKAMDMGEELAKMKNS